MSFDSTNPTTGELLGTYPEHTAHDIDLCLQSAWDGWKKWSRTLLSERTAFLIRMADLLEKRVEEYARLITMEMGKPIGEARGEVKKAAKKAARKGVMKANSLSCGGKLRSGSAPCRLGLSRDSRHFRRGSLKTSVSGCWTPRAWKNC